MNRWSARGKYLKMKNKNCKRKQITNEIKKDLTTNAKFRELFLKGQAEAFALLSGGRSRMRSAADKVEEVEESE